MKNDKRLWGFFWVMRFHLGFFFPDVWDELLLYAISNQLEAAWSSGSVTAHGRDLELDGL